MMAYYLKNVLDVRDGLRQRGKSIKTTDVQVLPENIYGVIVELCELDKYGAEVKLCDEQTASLKVKLDFELGELKPHLIPGNIVRIEDVHVTAVNSVCAGIAKLGKLRVLDPFEMAVIPSALQAEEDGRTVQLTHWYSDELLKIPLEKLSNLKLPMYIKLVGQVVTWETPLDPKNYPADSISIWDGTMPTLKVPNPYAHEKRPYFSRREDESLISSTGSDRKGNEPGKCIFFKIFEDSFGYSAIRESIQPGEFVACINILLDQDKSNYKLTMHQSNQKVLRLVAKNSYLGIRFQDRLDNCLFDSPWPMNSSLPEQYSASESGKLNVDVTDDCTQEGVNDSQIEEEDIIEIVQSTSVNVEAEVLEVEDFLDEEEVIEVEEFFEEVEVFEEEEVLEEDVHDERENEVEVLEPSELQFPAVLICPIPRYFHTIKDFLELDTGVFYSLHAAAVRCLPKNPSLETLIYLKCSACNFCDSMKSILKEITEQVLERFLNSDPNHPPKIACPVCLKEDDKEVHMEYSYKLNCIIEGPDRDATLIVCLYGLAASMVFGYAPTDALTSAKASMEVLKRVNDICPCTTEGRNFIRKRLLNWVIQPLKPTSNPVQDKRTMKYLVLTVTPICSSQEKALIVRKSNPL